MGEPLKPRITLDELHLAKKPGGAWTLARDALDLGDIARARAFLPYMVESDRKLMQKRIEARLGADERN